MNKLLLCILFLLLSFSASAQRSFQVQGAVQDSTGVPLAGSIIVLKTATDSLTVVADNNGLFNFNVVKTASFSLKVRLIGFNEYTNHYQFGSNLKLIKIPAVWLRKLLQQLKAVNIVDANPISLNFSKYG